MTHNSSSVNAKLMCPSPMCYYQLGITCIGFRDAQEKEQFCHQLDRVVCWLSEKAERQRERVVDRGDRKKRGKAVADGEKKAPKPNE